VRGAASGIRRTKTHSASALSRTQASLANHSCSVRQNGQCERPKNTGMARKRAGSASYPVGISRPVFGHLIMTVAIVASRGMRSYVIGTACERGLTPAGQFRGMRIARRYDPLGIC
jgi:hypothetical protein